MNSINSDSFSAFKYSKHKKNLAERFIEALVRYKYVYLMLTPGMVCLLLFRYAPMYGILLAFKNYRPKNGFFGSPWIGLQQFIKFLEDPYSFILFKNTFLLGIFGLLWGFPMTIIFALLLNEINMMRVKKYLQTFSYLPYFVSTIIIIGIFKEFMDLNTGIINDLIKFFGGEPVYFFGKREWFRPIYIISSIWQSVGFGSIIYMAAISGIDLELYESAVIDGSSRFKNLLFITIPSILPTITVMLILAVGGILDNNFTRILLIYNAANMETADVLQTYIYRVGLLGGSYSFGAAVGLMNSIVSFFFLFVTNNITRRIGDGNSLW